MKTVYCYDGDGNLTSQLSVADGASLAGTTEVAPSRDLLKVFERFGYGSVTFDRKAGKWKADRQAVARRVRDEALGAAAEGTSGPDFQALLPYVVCGLTGRLSFPLKAGEATYGSLDALYDAYAQSLTGRDRLDEVVDVIVGGGTAGGVEVRGVESQNVAELASLSVEEAVLQVADLLRSGK